jgi:hypothetical protein
MSLFSMFESSFLYLTMLPRDISVKKLKGRMREHIPTSLRPDRFQGLHE